MPEEDINKQILAELRLIRSSLGIMTQTGIQLHKPSPKYYKDKEAAEILGLSVKMLKYFTRPKANLIPHSGLGERNKRFSDEDLAKWYADNRVAALTETRNEFVQKSRVRKETRPSKSSGSEKVLTPQEKRKALAQSYGEYLGNYEWDFFTVFTTNYPLSAKMALTLMERFYEVLGKTNKVSCVWVAEKFSQSDSYHIHCLIKYHDSVVTIPALSKITRSVWQRIAGKGKEDKDSEPAESKNRPVAKPQNETHRVSIEIYDKSEHGNFYLTHKMQVEQNEYDFWGMELFNSGENVSLYNKKIKPNNNAKGKRRPE